MRIAVVGVGLIGGSIGLAARRRCGAHVVGYDPDRGALDAALAVGAIDEARGSVADAVGDVETVFVAAPVRMLPTLIGEALRCCGPSCVISDVGSTKRTVMQAINDPRFVGGHPLAGAETAGVAHAREDLFDGSSWYLMPSSGTSTDLLERLRGLIAAFGADPVSIDVELHDRLMAQVSHLPHVFANVLVATAAGSLQEQEDPSRAALLGAGPSFRDATRVAGANTAIWTDIYLSNAEQLVEAIDDAIKRLAQARTMLAASDESAVAAWNERARAQREQLTTTRARPNAGPAGKA